MDAVDKQKVAEIREKIAHYRRIKEDAEGEISGLYARLKPIQYRCKHPEGYKTSCMGDTGFKCDDCGYSY